MASLINQQITLDLIPGPVIKTVSVSQYDTGTRTLQFKIQNDGVDFTIPSGITASIEATKKDLTGFSYPCTISGNTVSVVVQPQMTVFPGKTMCEIVFKQGNDRIGTANFWLKVEDAALNDSTIISETDIPGIANLSEAVRTAVESAESAEQNALDAEAWAVGTRDGVAVPSTDPTYHNNSKYYSETFEGDVDRIEALVQQAEALAESIYSIGIVESASGDPASFTDGASNVPMKSVSVDIDPVQDLHGYEYPWVGGAGKNKFITFLNVGTFEKNGLSFTVDGEGQITVKGTATANTFQSIGYFTGASGTNYTLNGCPSGGSTGTYRMTLINVGYDTGNGLDFTGNGNRMSINVDIYSGQNVNLIFKPMIRLASVSDATFAPYSNICPISGWDEVKVTRTGGNLFDWGRTSIGAISENNGQDITATNVRRTDYYIPIDPHFTYRMKNGGTLRYFEYNADMEFARSFTANANTDIVFSANTKYTRIHGSLESVADNCVFYVYTGTVPSDNLPFTGIDVYPISLASAGTVYGGTLDATTGELVVDRVFVTLTDLSWTKQSGYSEYRALFSTSQIPPAYYVSDSIISDIVCSCYKALSPSQSYRGANRGISANDRYISIGEPSADSLETFMSIINGQTAAYRIATPLTYTLTPTQITSLLGTNHVWADCGEVSCEYVADTKMYIQNLLASQG